MEHAQIKYLRIIKCSDPSYWYAKEIGKVYVSHWEYKLEDRGYMVRAKDGYLNYIFDGDYLAYDKFPLKRFKIKSCSIPGLWYEKDVGGVFTETQISHETDKAVWLSRNYISLDNAWIYKKDLEEY